jgi:tripeptide aminopeptidase
LIAVSSDANIPMSLGIPAIGIGSGAAGGREHAPDEYIDVAKPDSVRGMSVGLATVVAAAGGLAR